MNPENIVCEVCGAVVERNKYERHIKYGHKEKRENKCHLCHKHFTSLYNLQYHLAHHLNARNFLCNECPRAYNTAADLAQHQRIHEKQRDPYSCHDCGLFFQIRSKYNTHMRIHQTSSAKGPKECPICKKMFVCLSSHNRIVHLGMRTYECSECDKSFGKKSGLDRHTLTVHQKVRGYKCDVAGCHGAFGEKSQLTKHLKTHSEKDLSYCSFCKQHFDDIRDHFETVHEDLTNHCKICFKRFSKQSSLKLHVKVFHTMEKNFFCDLCPNKGFAERFQFKRHLRRHQGTIQLSEHDRENDSETDESIESSRSIISMEIEPEQVFVDDFDIKPDTDCLDGATAEDVLVEIKIEVTSDQGFGPHVTIPGNLLNFLPASDDEGLQEIKVEPPDEVKVEDESDKGSVVEDIKSEKLSDSFAFQKEFIATKSIVECLFIDDRSDEFEAEPESCPGCGSEFESKTELQKHFDESHRTENGFSCQKCDKEFSKPDYLKVHFLAAHTEKSFNCNQCGKNFRYKSALDRHVRVVHENQRGHVCSKCGKSFGLKYDLTKHYETDHDESKKLQRTCQICTKVFSKERNLQIHILAIHREKSFECEICTKKFSFKSAKDRHVKVVHNNERNHQCSFCQKFFGVKADLRNHIAFHHSSNPEEIGKYYCFICERNFTSSSALARHHKGVHENIKQKRPRDYRCKFCKETLANKYQKEKHLAQVHQDGLKPTRTCRLCSMEFKLFDDFKVHLESHPNAHFCMICGVDHSDEESLSVHLDEHKHIDMTLRRFTCDFCGHRLFNKIQLKVHMRKHMKEKNFYVCDVCGQSYKYISPFLYHKKVHEGKKDFVCTHCGKEFMRKQDLVVHTRSHTQEKPFKCTVCDKRFGAKQILYVHLQTHSSTRKTFSCDECGVTFVDKNQAKAHDESHHPERRPFWCNYCKKSFKLEHLLKIHKKHRHKNEEPFGVEAALDTSQCNDFYNLWTH